MYSSGHDLVQSRTKRNVFSSKKKKKKKEKKHAVNFTCRSEQWIYCFGFRIFTEVHKTASMA